MTKPVMWLLALLVGALAVLAVQQRRPDSGALQRPAADLSTPDSAVKSYWHLRDWVRRESAAGRLSQSDPNATAQIMSAVTAEGAQESFRTRPGSADPLGWSLVRIEQTGEDRAVAIAKIRNLSQEPLEITPTAIELFQTQPGSEFHYILGKTAEGWKVIEVWRLDGPDKRARVR